MTLTPSRRSLSVGGAALTLLVGASLFPAVAASASAEEAVPTKPACPQATAALGFPIQELALTKVTTPPTPVEITVTGMLPDGITLSTAEGDKRVYLHGSPTKLGASTFTLNATVTNMDGTKSTSSSDCTMTVKAAPKVTRIQGADRYDQSVKVAEANFTAAPIVYVASGEKFTDALSAAAVAAKHESPLLLTPAAGVTPGVLAEITKLAPADIVVVGGAASVSDAVMTQLKATKAGVTVTRIDGADRFAVSRNLIANAKFGIPKSEDVYLATGANFPDALSASPAAALVDAPVLLVNGSETALTADEKAALTALGAKNAFIVGGPASVSAALKTDLEKSYTTVRYDGADRLEVSQNVNEASFETAKSIYLASQEVFPDALSGGAAAGIDESPLYITARGCVSGPAAFAIGRYVPDEVIILGGLATLGADVDKLVRCGDDG